MIEVPLSRFQKHFRFIAQGEAMRFRPKTHHVCVGHHPKLGDVFTLFSETTPVFVARLVWMEMETTRDAGRVRTTVLRPQIESEKLEYLHREVHIDLLALINAIVAETLCSLAVSYDCKAEDIAIIRRVAFFNK